MFNMTFLREPAVCAARARSRSQNRRDIASGLMTPPIHPPSSPGISIWPSTEVDAINRAEMAGVTVEELRELVAELIARRTRGQEAVA